MGTPKFCFVDIALLPRPAFSFNYSVQERPRPPAELVKETLLDCRFGTILFTCPCWKFHYHLSM